MLKRGHSEAGYYCPTRSKADCLPATGAEREHFAALILKAIKVDQAYSNKRFFAAGSCDSTSYGELCASVKATVASYYGNLAKYGEVFKTIDPTRNRNAQEFARMQKGNKAANKKFEAAMFKAHPKFKDDLRVSNDAFWQEAFFDASAPDAIAGLNKIRKTFVEIPAV